MDLKASETYILGQLSQNLPPTLYYHGVMHTLDVTKVAMQLAEAEGITDPTELCLLHTAALYHDAGFLVTYQEHEAASCQVARNVLPQFGYTSEAVEAICAIIMATRVPQAPATRLQQILCDADLDYLGRKDFPQIARMLFKEWHVRHFVDTEENWNQVQIRFMENHHYWTPTAKQWRQAGKEEHLRQLQEQLGGALG